MDRVKKMVHYWCDDIKKAGFTGKGVTVAVLDTGLAPHPDFKSRVVGWRDCIYIIRTVSAILWWMSIRIQIRYSLSL